MPFQYSFDVYRREIDEIMNFQLANAKRFQSWSYLILTIYSLRKHLRSGGGQKSQARSKKLTVFVKKATFKVKTQSGSLKKLHQKIITYERLVNAVKRKAKVLLCFSIAHLKFCSGEKRQDEIKIIIKVKFSTTRLEHPWIWLFGSDDERKFRNFNKRNRTI